MPSPNRLIRRDINPLTRSRRDRLFPHVSWGWSPRNGRCPVPCSCWRRCGSGRGCAAPGSSVFDNGLRSVLEAIAKVTSESHRRLRPGALAGLWSKHRGVPSFRCAEDDYRRAPAFIERLELRIRRWSISDGWHSDQQRTNQRSHSHWRIPDFRFHRPNLDRKSA
jgi:hypothetical protein